MSAEAANRTDWRSWRVGDVPITSPRGLGAALLLLASVAGVFYGPVAQLVAVALEGSAPETVELDRDLLALNLAANTVLLLLLPVVALALARPGRAGAVAERLRLVITSKTPVQVLIGVGATVASMVVLGSILYGLAESGIYEAQESALVPQIQALLDWPHVIAIPSIAAVTEEVFFRGLLQPRIGIVATSLLFGFVHLGYGTVLQFVAPALLGLLFGYIFLKTQSLWAPIAAHFTFDFIELGLLYYDKTTGG